MAAAENGANASERARHARAALRRMSESEPELAARLILQGLPAAAAGSRVHLHYALELEGMGSYRVDVRDGHGSVEPAGGNGPGAQAPDGAGPGRAPDFTMATDPKTFAQLAAGRSPLGAVLGGDLKLSGKRRRALRLRKLSGDASARELARLGLPVDPDLIFRSIPYALEPQWTRGRNFTVVYHLTPDGTGQGGRWAVKVDDGRVELLDPPPAEGADATVTMAHGHWLAVLSGEVSPTDAMQRQWTRVDGYIHAVTLLGRWLERANGTDEAEQRREERQRAVQAARTGTWTASGAGAEHRVAINGASPVLDPAQSAAKGGAATVPLMTYHQLYALWERQNWKVHELDFSVDKEHWAATPGDGQRHLSWTLGNFYVGEERVTADLAPFVVAAPSGEVEAFLSTQLVDEARHAVFFDRFGAEVMALDAGDLRGRLREISEATLTPAWSEVFDGNLRAVAHWLRDHPDDLDAFVDGVVIYHMVVEGFLAMTGQRTILQYMEDHDMYPGFQAGFGLVERDEHRHIAFGVRFLRDACEANPAYRDRIERKLAELVPVAAHVFVPPYVDSAEHFVSYGYTSEEIYGYAYRALKRRMAVVGLEAPPPEELMPGPIAEPTTLAA